MPNADLQLMPILVPRVVYVDPFALHGPGDIALRCEICRRPWAGNYICDDCNDAIERNYERLQDHCYGD